MEPTVTKTAELEPPAGYAVGIDLGGSSVKAVSIERTGRILCRHQFDFEPDAPKAWARIVQDVFQQVQAEREGPAASLGISAPGLAAPDQFSIAFMPGRLQGLEGLNWAEYLGWSRPVPVLNDAHAALLGEAWLGAAAGLQNVFMLTLGTGVGGAAMVDGRLLRGTIGRAGHLGHICLDLDGPLDITRTPGSLEWHIGNCSIAERTSGRFTSTHALLQAHAQDNGEATRVWLKSVHALACGIVSLINVLDPEAVIIGGGIARAGEALFAPLAKALEEFEWRPGGHRVEMLPAELGEFAGAVGAAHVGLEGIADGERPVNNL